MKKLILPILAGFLAFGAFADDEGSVDETLFEDNTLPQLLRALKDAHAVGADYWIYNDYAKAVEEARRLNKPIFVTFRCVPCEDCSSFDAEVAQGNEVIKELARTAFVPVRQVEMKGVDLSLFEFDFDLNWAAVFVNADGVIYGRYGTQSAEGADAYNSIASLRKAMVRALEFHAEYPGNAQQFAAKKPQPKPYRTALEMPGLPRKNRYRQQTARDNCIHCHNIHDAQQNAAYANGTFSREMLYRYPLPENIGLSIQRDDGRIIEAVNPAGVAAKTGLRSGDEILKVNGQPILSIADIQWVLHGLSNAGDQVRIEAKRQVSADATAVVLASIQLDSGWKETDISWRGSMWSLQPRPGFWAVGVEDSEKSRYGISPEGKGLHVRWINRGIQGGRASYESGLREGDVIVGINGKPLEWNEIEFQSNVRLNMKVGEVIRYQVKRKDKIIEIVTPLVGETP